MLEEFRRQITLLRCLLTLASVPTIFTASLVYTVPGPLDLFVDTTFISSHLLPLVTLVALGALVINFVYTSLNVQSHFRGPTWVPGGLLGAIAGLVNVIIAVGPFLVVTAVFLYLYLGSMAYFMLLPVVVGLSLLLTSWAARSLQSFYLFFNKVGLNFADFAEAKNIARREFRNALVGDGLKISVLMIALSSFLLGTCRIANLGSKSPIEEDQLRDAGINSLSVIGVTGRGILLTETKEAVTAMDLLGLTGRIFIHTDHSGSSLLCARFGSCIGLNLDL